MDKRNLYVLVPDIEFIRIGNVYISKFVFNNSHNVLLHLGLLKETEWSNHIFEAVMSDNVPE
jgi:hypothetical protein